MGHRSLTPVIFVPVLSILGMMGKFQFVVLDSMPVKIHLIV